MIVKIPFGPIIFVAYLVGAILTFGRVWNASDWTGRPLVGASYDETEAYQVSTSGNVAAAIFSGIAWPFFWAGVAAIEVTR